MAASASLASRLAMASMAFANCASASPPIWATPLASASSCSSKDFTMCSVMAPRLLDLQRPVRDSGQADATETLQFYDSGPLEGTGTVFDAGRKTVNVLPLPGVLSIC